MKLLARLMLFLSVVSLPAFVEMQALQSGKLLSKEKLAAATKPQFGDYGFGFVTGAQGALQYYGHGGGAPGMNGELRICPESGLVIVVLSNLDPPAATNMANFLDLRISRWPT